MRFDENGNPIEDAAATVDESTIGDFLDNTSVDPIDEGDTGDDSGPPQLDPAVPSESIDPKVVPIASEVPKTLESASVTKTEIEFLKEQNEKLTKLFAESIASKTESSKITPDIEELPTVDKLLEGVDFDDIMSSKENFSKFLVGLLNSSRQETLKTIQSIIPDAIGAQVDSQMSMKEIANNFYSTHKELSAVKPYVATIANTVAKEHPDWKVGQVLEESAKIARENLGISHINVSDIPTPSSTKIKNKPSLPGGTQVTSRPSGGKKESDAIMDLIED
jgi:hypothetical protein